MSTVRAMLIITLMVSGMYFAALIVIPVTVLNDLIDGALIGLCFLVAYHYWTWTIAHLNFTLNGETVIRYGISGVWFWTGAWRIERFLFQEKIWGTVSIGIHDWFRGWAICMCAYFAALHVLAYDMREGRPNPKSVYSTFICSFLGIAAVVVIQIYLRDFGTAP